MSFSLNNSSVTAQTFGSGSSGNALLIRTDRSALLVDCGVGIRTIRAGLLEHGLTLADIDAVLVTHEHRDHVQTLPKVLRDDLPVIATRGTARAARLPIEMTQIITASRPVTIAGATVHALPVRHDASDPCGFFIEIAGAGITVLTDLGCWEDHLVDAAMASDLVLLEANYNEAMLRHGPYPAHLKRRVASGVGHLGNAACGVAMAPVAKQRGDKTTWWLTHLSATNNNAQQAERDVREALLKTDAQARVTALPRREPGPIWTFQATMTSSTTHRHDPSPHPAQLSIPGFD